MLERELSSVSSEEATLPGGSGDVPIRGYTLFPSMIRSRSMPHLSRSILMGISSDPPGRAASSDDTEDSSRSSIVTALILAFQMMLQFDISPDLLPVRDSAVVPHGGHFGHFIFIC